MRFVKIIGFAWIGLIASAAAQNPSEKDRIFEEFAAAYAVVHITPYERRDHEGVPAGAYQVLDQLMIRHWRVLLSDIERLPIHPGRKNSVSTASKISEACEALPPFEYLDLLDKILDLTEAGKIPSGIAEARFSGYGAKNYFIIVNYEHPRVKKLIERARIVCADNEQMLHSLELYADGKLADNYLTNESEDAPRPQTLPGIELLPPYYYLLRTLAWIAFGMVALTVFAIWRIQRRVKIWRKRWRKRAVRLETATVRPVEMV